MSNKEIHMNLIGKTRRKKDLKNRDSTNSPDGPGNKI